MNDGTFNAALARFGTRGLVELVVTLGYFAMIALPLNAFEIEMSAAQQSQRKPFAPLAVRGRPWTSSEDMARAAPPLSDSRASRPRVRLLATHDDLAPQDQHFLDRVIRTRGWIAPAFGLLLHTPDVAERIAAIGEFFLYLSSLPRRAKALAWLITARELDSNYTWAAGVNAARRAGMEAEMVATLERGKPLAGLSREDAALVAFCQELLRGNHHVSDSTYEAVVNCFGLKNAVQISTAVGYIAMMSLIVNPFEIPNAADGTRPAV